MRYWLKLILLIVIASPVMVWGAGTPTNPAAWITQLQSLGALTFWSTPSAQGHAPFIQGILSAKSYIKLSMFHLTDPDVVAALKVAAQKPGMKIQIIVNRGGLASAGTLAVALDLAKTPNIEVRASPAFFRILHTKAMYTDLPAGIVSYITTINLTNTFLTSRDYGLTTDNTHIFSEGNSVFDVDWQNSDADLSTAAQQMAAVNDKSVEAPPADSTPELSQPNLLWSPVNSEQKIVDVIDYAAPGETLTSSVENLRNREVIKAFLAAAARGVKVNLMVPEVDQNPDPTYNFMAIREMLAADTTGNLQIKVMPNDPVTQLSTSALPYIHAKMIILTSSDPERNLGMISSENFSDSSLLYSREVGVVFRELLPALGIKKAFAQDWQVAIDPKTSKFWNQPPPPPPQEKQTLRVRAPGMNKLSCEQLFSL